MRHYVQKHTQGQSVSQWMTVNGVDPGLDLQTSIVCSDVRTIKTPFTMHATRLVVDSSTTVTDYVILLQRLPLFLSLAVVATNTYYRVFSV